MGYAMLRFIASVVAVFWSMVATAQVQFPVERPVQKVGDSWTYRTTIDSGVVEETRTLTTITDRTYEYDALSAGKQVTRSLTRDLNIHGQTPLGNYNVIQRFSWPLTIGAKWHSTAVSTNSDGTLGQFEQDWEVIGIESVTVPAGTFQAVRLRGEGYWKNLSSNNRDKYESDLWYAPDTRSWVKFDTRAWFRGDIGNRGSQVLLKYQLQK